MTGANVKNLSFLFLFILSTNVSAAKLTGAVTKIGEGSYLVRTADENVTLRSLGSSNADLIQQLEENIANPKIADFEVADSLIEKRERIPFGTRGDCGELPITADDLIKIVEEGKEDMNLIDFLQAIPEGTLESFTLISNTRSLQRGEGSHLVDEQNPRVLRQTMDGKLTVSFVCHEDQDKHNTVEIIHWDDEEEKFKTLSFDFGKPPGRGVGSAGEGKRIHENPQSCIACHGTSDKNGRPGSEHLKLNWPQYFMWGDCDIKRGVTMYGMSDDNMHPDAFRTRNGSYGGCSTMEDQRAHRRLNQEFTNLKRKAETDPCLSTLPWAKAPSSSESRVGIENAWSDEDYQYYPFASRAQDRRRDPTNISPNRSSIQNYSLRTNLRFTDVYGRLTGLRNSRLIRDNPNYDSVKYFLAMEGIPGCIERNERRQIARQLGLNLPSRGGSTDPSEYPLLKAFGDQIVGFENLDWTMHLPEAFAQSEAERSSSYNAAIVSNSGFRDQQIHDLTMGDIIQRVGAEIGGESDRDAKAIMTRGIEDTFGSRFSCIDDAGVGISRDMSPNQTRASQRLCDELRKKARAQGPVELKVAREVSSECSEETPEVEIPQRMLDQVIKQNERQGQELVGSCVGCHSGDHELGFITDDPSLTNSTEIARLKQNSENPEFWSKLEGHLNGSIEPRMPFGCEGSDCMNSGQTNAIMAYMRALTSSDYERVKNEAIGESSVSNCNSVNSSTTQPESETDDGPVRNLLRNILGR